MDQPVDTGLQRADLFYNFSFTDESVSHHMDKRRYKEKFLNAV